MEFAKVTLQDWEKLVQKQLKTDDIYPILNKENLEDILIKAYYETETIEVPKLPKIEESTHLVAKYSETLEENAYAFLIEKDVKFAEKTLFFSNVDLAKNIVIDSTNQYISLVDIFDKEQNIDADLGKLLLGKDFKRNINVDVSFYQNAGASLIQQLAIALAKTKDLVEELGADILPKLSFKFAVGHQYFLEIGKIRAFKYLFNQLSKEYNLDLVPYIFAETSLRNKAIHDEENNLIRSTLELSAAMIAGADAVFANDFKLINATQLSEELAFKQMIVLAYESIINVFEDASSGSYVVEDITRQLADKAWHLFLNIEQEGGFSTMMKSGAITQLIVKHAKQEQAWVQEGKIKLIGVNMYPQLEIKKNIETLYSETELKVVRWSEMFE